MPFAPSSPIRLYAPRKTRDGLNTRSDTAKNPRSDKVAVDRLGRLSPKADTESGSEIVASTQANQERREKISWEEDMATIRRYSNPQSLHQKLSEVERPLSIQEALAISTPGDESVQESALRDPTQRASALFDNTSESEYSVDDDAGPVVGRASSVRVSKPQIVEHKPIKLSKIQGYVAGHSRSSSQSSSRAERASDNHASPLPTMPEESSNDDPAWTIRSVEADNSEHHPPWTPVRETSVVPGLSPDSTISASLESPRKSLKRRVTIRPSDIVTKTNQDHSAFRESIVTTPYPSQMSDKGGSAEGAQNDDERAAEPKLRKDNGGKRTSRPCWHTPTDRFPSPERPERLFLILMLYNRPDSQVTIEIEVIDKTTFDDEALFKQIKVAYDQQLLNPQRRAASLIRKISHATVTGITLPTNRHHPTFNSTNFLQHLHNPANGRKRKTWILWLRNHNDGSISARTSRQTPPIRQLDNLTRLSTRARTASHSRQSSSGTKGGHSDQDKTKIQIDEDANKRLSTASDASSFYFAYSPGIPNLPFLSSSQKNDNDEPLTTSLLPENMAIPKQTTRPHPSSPTRSPFFFWPSLSSNTSSPTTTSLRRYDQHSQIPRFITNNEVPDLENQIPALPTVTLHYTFRLRMLILLTLLDILLGVLCAIVWVIFGVPGTRPGSASGSQSDLNGVLNLSWKVTAQGRVLTGCVIGFVVFVGGCVLEGVACWMGAIVL